MNLIAMTHYNTVQRTPEEEDKFYAQCIEFVNLEANHYGVSIPEVLTDVSTKLSENIEHGSMHTFMPDRENVDYQFGQSYLPALPQANYRAIPTSGNYLNYPNDGNAEGNDVLRQFNYLYPAKLEFKNTAAHIADVCNALRCSKETLENTLSQMKEKEVWSLEKQTEQLDLVYEAKNIFEKVTYNIIENNAEHKLNNFWSLHDDNIGYFLLFVAYLPADDFLFLNNYLYAYDQQAVIHMMESAMNGYANYLERLQAAQFENTVEDERKLTSFMNAITSYFERLNFINRCFVKESVYGRENIERVNQLINQVISTSH